MIIFFRCGFRMHEQSSEKYVQTCCLRAPTRTRVIMRLSSTKLEITRLTAHEVTMGRLNHSITGTGCDTLIKHLIIINTLSWTSERDKEDFIGNELDFSNNC